MGLWVDIIALIIIIVCAGIAYYRGFVKTFFGFISTIVAILLASFLCKPVAEYVKVSTEMDEWIITSVTSITSVEQTENIESEDSVEYEVDQVASSSNEEHENNNATKNNNDLEKDSLIIKGENIINDEAKNKDNSGIIDFIDTLPAMITESFDFEDEKNEMITSVAIKISDIVINILSWIIIYGIVRIILAIATLIFDGIMSIPFLKTINNVAGLALGVLMGIFRIYLILAIIYFISNIANIEGVVNVIQSSIVVSHMYNSNLLISLIF